MANLHLRGLSKNYGETRVLEGVDLEVEDGEYLVLVGPSGCGKSTLLRMIAGLEDVSSGRIDIAGIEELNNGKTPKTVKVTATKQDGSTVEFDGVVRIDTPGEADYYRNGGILQFVLRNMLKS